MTLHKLLELPFRDDGENALPGIAIGDFYDGLAAHLLDPERYFLLAHVPYGLWRVDFEPQAFQFCIEKIVGFRSDQLVAPTGEASQHGVQYAGFGVYGNTRPGPLGNVAKSSAYRMPVSLYVPDLQYPLAEAVGRVWGAVKTRGEKNGLFKHIGYDSGIAGNLHEIFIVQHGQATGYGQAFAL